MKISIIQSKAIVCFLIFAFILLITTEAMPEKGGFENPKEDLPVVRVKPAVKRLTTAQQQQYDRLMEEGKRMLQSWMDYNAAIQKFNEALPLAVSKGQKSDVYYYLSLAYYANLENKGEEIFIQTLKKLIETDFYRQLDKNECPPRFIERVQTLKNEYGILKILSSPAGADVFLGNSKRPAGKTPLTVIRKAGPVRVKVQKGRKKKQETLQVAAGKETSSPMYVLTGKSSLIYIIGGVILAGGAGAAALLLSGGKDEEVVVVETTGSIHITSTPTGAAVYLDGTQMGTTEVTLTGITPGSHFVRLVLANYADYNESVEVVAGQTLQVTAALTQNTISVTKPVEGQQFLKAKNLKIAIEWKVNGSTSAQSGLSSDANLRSVSQANLNSSSLLRRRGLWFRSASQASRQRIINRFGQDSSRNGDKIAIRTQGSRNSYGRGSAAGISGESGREIDIGSRSLRPGGAGFSASRISAFNPHNTDKPSDQARPLAVAKVNILLIHEVNNVEFTEQIVKETAQDGKYNWAVGENISVGQYFIRIISSTNSNVYGESGTFQIVEATYTYKYVKQFTAKNMTKDFKLPNGVAVDNEFNVYVADTDNHRIVKLDRQGNYILDWPSKKPYQIAIDSSGYIYVAEAEKYRVAKYDSDGNYQNVEWKNTGGQVGRIEPYGVAVDHNGNVYIADRLKDRIIKGDSTGGNIQILIGSGLNDPWNVAVDGLANLYVTSRFGNVVKKYDSSGKKLANIESAELHYPTGIAVDNKGHLIVSNESDTKESGRNQKAVVFSTSGTYLTKFGRYGFDVDEFVAPMGVAADKNGNIYIIDRHDGHRRVSKWEPVIVK